MSVHQNTEFMKRLLIIKFGAAGDVVRTTPLLHLFPGWEIDWLTAPENTQLVPHNKVSRVLTENGKTFSNGVYDLVINLEDDEALLRRILPNVTYRTIFGSYTNGSGTVEYTSDSAGWFDLGLASIHGPKKADALKLINRKTYQELIFQGLGHQFRGEPYLLPDSLPPSNLHGDVAIAAHAGARWPMKNWPFFGKLASELSEHYRVNFLPIRETLAEHISDICQHRLVIAPDSLPMHLALGLGIKCVAIFTCTSPWEIHDYGLLTKIVSPKLEEYFYRRDYVEEAVTCIPYTLVYHTVVAELEKSG